MRAREALGVCKALQNDKCNDALYGGNKLQWLVTYFKYVVTLFYRVRD